LFNNRKRDQLRTGDCTTEVREDFASLDLGGERSWTGRAHRLDRKKRIMKIERGQMRRKEKRKTQKISHQSPGHEI